MQQQPACAIQLVPPSMPVAAPRAHMPVAQRMQVEVGLVAFTLVHSMQWGVLQGTHVPLASAYDPTSGGSCSRQAMSEKQPLMSGRALRTRGHMHAQTEHRSKAAGGGGQGGHTSPAGHVPSTTQACRRRPKRPPPHLTHIPAHGAVGADVHLTIRPRSACCALKRLAAWREHTGGTVGGAASEAVHGANGTCEQRLRWMRSRMATAHQRSQMPVELSE